MHINNKNIHKISSPTKNVESTDKNIKKTLIRNLKMKNKKSHILSPYEKISFYRYSFILNFIHQEYEA